MQTIPEIVNFFNDGQAFIAAAEQPEFTYADIKKQIDSTKVFFEKNLIQKTDTVAIVCENGPLMATSFLASKVIVVPKAHAEHTCSFLGQFVLSF